jgi:hypothetical protein
MVGGGSVVKLLPFAEAVKRLTDPVGTDDDFAIESEQVPLRDSMTLRRLEHPCRGDTCTHAECFELQSYVASFCESFKASQQAEPRCPVCSKLLPPESLHTDELFWRILQELPANADTVAINFAEATYTDPCESSELVHEVLTIIDSDGDGDGDGDDIYIIEPATGSSSGGSTSQGSSSSNGPKPLASLVAPSKPPPTAIVSMTSLRQAARAKTRRAGKAPAAVSAAAPSRASEGTFPGTSASGGSSDGGSTSGCDAVSEQALVDMVNTWTALDFQQLVSGVGEVLANNIIDQRRVQRFTVPIEESLQSVFRIGQMKAAQIVSSLRVRLCMHLWVWSVRFHAVGCAQNPACIFLM